MLVVKFKSPETPQLTVQNLHYRVYVSDNVDEFSEEQNESCTIPKEYTLYQVYVNGRLYASALTPDMATNLAYLKLWQEEKADLYFSFQTSRVCGTIRRVLFECVPDDVVNTTTVHAGKKIYTGFFFEYNRQKVEYIYERDLLTEEIRRVIADEDIKALLNQSSWQEVFSQEEERFMFESSQKFSDYFLNSESSTANLVRALKEMFVDGYP
jgi:hypothetical protein